MVSFEDLLKIIRDYNPEEEAIITKAYYFAEEHFKDKFRDSGEPYITHPLFIACMAAKFFKADRVMVISALLHDCVEDCDGVTIELIKELFGPEVAFLVDGVTRDPSFNTGDKLKEQLLNEQRMFTFMVKDIRVFILKVLDRVHNLITLSTLKGDEKQKRKAKESLDLYVRLLDAFGMNELKQYIEDLALSYFDPIAFKMISDKVNKIRKESEEEIRNALDQISEEIYQSESIEGKENHKPFKLEVKPKSINEIYKKLNNGYEFDYLHDVLAIKIMVEDRVDCYKASEIINRLFPPFPHFSKDYIAKPKKNGYQAIHTTSLLKNNRFIQFRIKTFDMENKSRKGITNYWSRWKGEAYNKMLEALRTDCEIFRYIENMVKNPNYSAEDVIIFNEEWLPETVQVSLGNGEEISVPVGSNVIDLYFMLFQGNYQKINNIFVNGRKVSKRFNLESEDIIMFNVGNERASDSYLNKLLRYPNTKTAKSKILSLKSQIS